MVKPLAFFTAVFALCLAVSSEEHSWTRFKPGTWVKVRTTTKLSGEAYDEETKWTLVDVTTDYYTVKIETTMGGNALPSTEVKIPLAPSAEPEWTWEEKEGEELELDGKKTACKVKLGLSADKKSTKKVWTCDVGGRPLDVKWELKLSVAGAERTQTGVVKKLSEPVKIGARDVTCWSGETTLEAEGQRTVTLFWESWDVPGQRVKSESTTTSGALTITSNREVVEFEVK